MKEQSDEKLLFCWAFFAEGFSPARPESSIPTNGGSPVPTGSGCSIAAGARNEIPHSEERATRKFVKGREEARCGGPRVYPQDSARVEESRRSRAEVNKEGGEAGTIELEIEKSCGRPRGRPFRFC